MSEQQAPLLPSSISFRSEDIERRKQIVDLTPEDIERIKTFGDILTERSAEYTDGFFRYLANLNEAPLLFRNRDALEEARRRKHEHIDAWAKVDFGRDYVEQRVTAALLYSRYGLETRVFLGAFHHLMRRISSDIVQRFVQDAPEAMSKFVSLNKVAYFDISIMVDVLFAERERIIGRQQEAIRDLSTPVLLLRDGLLILPIIGLIDSQRAKQLTDALLHAIRANRARMCVMDITGVAAVDSKVANHLIQTVAAARLMGSTVIITGLSAEVAQALVALGVDLGKILTTADLQGGLEEAERILGYRMIRSGEAPPQRSES